MPNWKTRDTLRARELRSASTPAERLLWQHLSRKQTGTRFSRQMPVGPYFADFLSRELRMVIECDGISHDRNPCSDSVRDRWMAEAGFTVLRFTNAEVLGNVEGVVALIVQTIRQIQALEAHP
jgi:very-short-patch-repair endonuclease